MMSTSNANHPVLSRRRMLTRTTRAAAALALTSSLAPLFAAPEKRGFRIGACDWSLRHMDPGAFEVAKQIGLDGVQVSLGTAANQMHLRQPEVQRTYLEASRKSGVAIASLAIGEMNNIPLKSDPRAAVWLEDSIPVMVALGVKVVLIAEFNKGELKGDRAGVDHTVEVLQRIAPKAEKAGVILGIENYLSAEENLDILARVNSPAVQVYYDVGNSTDKGYDIYQEIRMLKGKVCEFHAKDAGYMLGQGRVDFHKVRQAMDDIDYRGWIQIEAAAPHNLVADYQAHLKFLKSVFPAA